jgi:hypothetical protein
MVVITQYSFVSAQSLGNEQATTFQGWNVRDTGGHYSESSGTIRIWSDAHDQGIGFYKRISPTGDFEFSLQVKANRIDGFGILIGKESFLNGSKEGVQFEFHKKYGVDTFLLARFVHTIVWETGKYGDVWDWQGFAYGRENVWYTMKLTVQANPFKVSGEVFDENGVSMGTCSVSDMINFTFEDIAVLGFGNGWGGDYSIRNISMVDSVSGGFGQTEQTQISITPEASTAALTVPVKIGGSLLDSKGNPLTNEIVVLSYTFPGIEKWVPITSSRTNMAGEYSIYWANTASGDFALKAEWSGNTTHQAASNTTAISVLPYQNEAVFFVESNSTVNALTFNSDTSELGFSVSGPSGTSGYARISIAKGLLASVEDLKVLLDGKQLDYSAVSTGDSWIITLNYSHSTHEISMQLASNGAAAINSQSLVWIALTVATLSIAVLGAAFFKRKHR